MWTVPELLAYLTMEQAAHERVEPAPEPELGVEPELELEHAHAPEPDIVPVRVLAPVPEPADVARQLEGTSQPMLNSVVRTLDELVQVECTYALGYLVSVQRQVQVVVTCRACSAGDRRFEL